MARILAIDYGTKRTGIAITDELQIIASGLTTVKTKDIFSFLKTYTSKEQVELFLLGEPKQMDNTASESEVFISKFLRIFNFSRLIGEKNLDVMTPKTLKFLDNN